MHSTSNLKDGYLGSGTHLRHAIRKYGIDNFKIEILEWCNTRENLIEKEKEIITDNHINNPNCYNLKFGGLGGGGFVNKEHQFKCSQAAGIKHREKMLNDEEYRKKISQQTSESNKRRYIRGDIKSWKDTFNWTGKKHSEDTKIKIGKINSIKQKGENNSQFGTCWITNGMENKKIKNTETVPSGWKLGRLKKPI
jgi:hypothetical protein